MWERGIKDNFIVFLVLGIKMVELLLIVKVWGDYWNLSGEVN